MNRIVLSLIFAALHWVFFVIFIIVFISRFKSGLVWSWEEFAVSAACFMILVFAADYTAASIKAIRNQPPPLPPPPTKEEMAAMLEDAKKKNEEEDKKFLTVLAGLGFNDPLADFLLLTTENKVRWKKIPNKWCDYLFRAENVIDGIGLECIEDMEIETIPLGPAVLCREIIFRDNKNRFADRYFNSIAVGGETREKDSEEKLVDEYAEWLKNKFKNKKPA